MWYIYKIFYKQKLVYIGRTNNIDNRIRQHMLSGKLIDILRVSRVEFADVETEADMNLYELYYILKYKPELNSKDTTKDQLTIELPELEFRTFYSHLWDKWVEKAKLKQLKKSEKNQRIQIAKEILKSDKSKLAQDILQQQIHLGINY